MNHSPSKALMNTRTVRSLPVSHSRYQPVQYNHSCAWVYTPYSSTLSCIYSKYSPIHISPRIIFMYISTHLYIYLHASYSHIHVTKPRTCNNTTNMYQCCRYVTILRICNNTTNTYIYRCYNYNNSIYNTTSLPYLQR